MIATNFDPFARGYVKSLARPGSNVTGLFLRQQELAEKQTEILFEAFPDRVRLGILWDSNLVGQFTTAERRAKTFGLQVHSLKLDNPPYDFDAAFRTLAEGSPQMLRPVQPTFHHFTLTNCRTRDYLPIAHNVRFQDLRRGGGTLVVWRGLYRDAPASCHPGGEVLKELSPEIFRSSSQIDLSSSRTSKLPGQSALNYQLRFYCAPIR